MHAAGPKRDTVDDVTHGVVVIESLVHREQFDDWLAGGRLEVNSAVCYWQAQDSGYGFGWDIEPALEDQGWPGLIEVQADAGVAAIARALRAHKYEYRF